MKNDSKGCVFDYIMNGILYNLSGKHDEAIKEFTHALNIAPEHKVAYYQRARAYNAMGNKNAVLEDLKSSARLGYMRAQNVLSLKNIGF